MSKNAFTSSLALWPRAEPADDEEQELSSVATLSLLAAARRLTFRGTGPSAWGAPLSDDPIAFLLDSTSDAVVVWSSAGRMVYANDAAEGLDLRGPAAPGVSTMMLGDRQLERRALHFTFYTTTYVVEIIRSSGRERR